MEPTQITTVSLEPQHVFTLLVCYSLTAAVASGLIIAWSGWSAGRLLVVVCSLLAVATTVSIGAYTIPSVNVFSNITRLLLERDRSQVMAAACGLGMGLPWFALLLDRGDRKPIGRWMYSLLLIAGLAIPIAASTVVIAKDVLLSAAYGMRIRSAAFARVSDERFAVDLFARTSKMPIRIATSDKDELFISVMSGWAAENAEVLRLVENSATGQVSETIVAEMLNRPFGLAYKNGELFVARSGVYTKYTNGRAEDIRVGAVTRLRDLDDDGIMDFYHDIVSDLPGAQGPDNMHQNNGLAFGPDGALYVTSGSPGERDHAVHPWEGTILKFDPSLENVEVFATGVRNPFSVVVLPNGDVLGTDQDTGDDPGDEINHYISGANYGHPYVVDDTPTAGARPPIYRGGGQVLCGMAYTESPNLPPEFHGIYVVDRLGRRILRGRLEKVAGTYNVSFTEFLKLTSLPVDIAITPSGVMFIISTDTKEVLRVRYAAS